AEQPLRHLPGLLGSLGQDRELSLEVGSSRFAWRCAMKGIASRLIELGTMLAQGPEGRCFSCTQSFNVSESPAKVAQSFCSRRCERAFIRRNLKHLTRTDRSRILELIENLLQSSQRNRL